MRECDPFDPFEPFQPSTSGRGLCRFSQDGYHHYGRLRQHQFKERLFYKNQLETVVWCQACLQPAVVKVDLVQRLIEIWERVG